MLQVTRGYYKAPGSTLYSDPYIAYGQSSYTQSTAYTDKYSHPPQCDQTQTVTYSVGPQNIRHEVIATW